MKIIRLDEDKFKIGKDFGGDQEWFSLFFGLDKLRDRGCGIVAFAQSLSYLSKTGEEYRNLYPYKETDRKSFSSFMLQLSRKLRPSFLGLPSLFFLKKGVRSYMKRFKQDLKSRELVNPKDLESLEEFIEEGLSRQVPIIYIGWISDNPLFKFHWTSITAIIKDDKKSQLEISSWGRKYSVNTDELLKTGLYKALIYFY